MKVPEILAPAGNMEHLETACLYGADAVYLGVQGGSNLRAGARNFTLEELHRAVGFAHARGVWIYLTLNTYPHDDQMADMPAAIAAARDAGVDAAIVSDLGVLSLVRELAPKLAVHLSTQANTVNTRAVNAWASLGVSRVILARELSFEEIGLIREGTGVELEMFIHGSVCVSISGRCLISSYLASRDANQGLCTQPCRWDYALVERTRQGQYMPVLEDEGFTFLYNSRDLCLLPLMDRVMGLGMDGLKIEGRNRTSLYIATIVQAYRRARDAFIRDPDRFVVDRAWMEEIGKVSNREYFTGFSQGRPDESGIRYDAKGYVHTHHLAARVVGQEGDEAVFEARNPLIEGMELEWLSSGGSRQHFPFTGGLVDGVLKKRIKPNEIFSMKVPFSPKAGELVRKPLSEGDRVVLGEDGL